MAVVKEVPITVSQRHVIATTPAPEVATVRYQPVICPNRLKDASHKLRLTAVQDTLPPTRAPLTATPRPQARDSATFQALPGIITPQRPLMATVARRPRPSRVHDRPRRWCYRGRPADFFCFRNPSKTGFLRPLGVRTCRGGLSSPPPGPPLRFGRGPGGLSGMVRPALVTGKSLYSHTCTHT